MHATDHAQLHAGEIYAEYVEQYCAHDMNGAVKRVQCPILFVGGEGDAASTHMESWAEALPASTPHEVVMAQIVDAGVGGIKAHGHASHYWARHVLTVVRFFSQNKK